jgi:Protein of unknown function (Gmx_para_CXXCG)
MQRLHLLVPPELERIDDPLEQLDRGWALVGQPRCPACRRDWGHARSVYLPELPENLASGDSDIYRMKRERSWEDFLMHREMVRHELGLPTDFNLHNGMFLRTVRYVYNYEPHDLMCDNSGRILVKKSVADAIATAGCAGVELLPLRIYNRAGLPMKDAPEFFELKVEVVEMSDLGIVNASSNVCLTCGWWPPAVSTTNMPEFRQRLPLRDFQRILGLGPTDICVSERVRDMIVDRKFSGMDFLAR